MYATHVDIARNNEIRITDGHYNASTQVPICMLTVRSQRSSTLEAKAGGDIQADDVIVYIQTHSTKYIRQLGIRLQGILFGTHETTPTQAILQHGIPNEVSNTSILNRGLYSYTNTNHIKSPSAAISGPPDSLMPISQSTKQSAKRPSRERILTAVNNSDGHQNTSSAAERTHQIRRDREKAENGTAKRGRSRDDTLEFLVHAALTVSSHDLDNHKLPSQLQKSNSPSVDL